MIARMRTIKGALTSIDEFTEHHVSHGPGKIYARDYAGAGPAYVLMHGFPDNLHIYDDLVPLFIAAGRRIVTFDFLGFGQSDKRTGVRYNFRQQRDDLKAVADYLNLQTLIPVTHDSSGAAAVDFAIDHPDRTAALVILNAAFAEPAAARWPELVGLFATTSLEALTSAIIRSPEQFAWIVNFQREQFPQSLASKHKVHYDAFLTPLIDQNFRQQPGAGPAFMQMTAEFFSELERNRLRLPQMKALDIPVKLIRGENDSYINTGVAKDFEAHLQHPSLYLLSAGHWPQLDEPGSVAEAMLS